MDCQYRFLFPSKTSCSPQIMMLYLPCARNCEALGIEAETKLASLLCGVYILVGVGQPCLSGDKGTRGRQNRILSTLLPMINLLI